MELREYARSDGVSPFGRWFAGLAPVPAARVTIALARLEAGHRSAIRWFRGIGEYRIDTGPGYRIYLMQDGPRLVLLLGGGTKHRQDRDIEAAIAARSDYLARKRQLETDR
ncbi:MAG TPA: type II toxin-antitoxin system RelE/ParE family toxin [Gemmatimonadales bacterium]|nr:type II toxin-antitoxin system RelE/ParE family toxin [Gemmatimonadales bacterium]